MLTKIKEHIVHILLKFIIKTYRAIYLPIRVFQVRRKKVIKVAFILSDLGKWKTETLYNKMLQNKRFEPIILVAPYIDRDNSGIDVLCSYLEEKGYYYQALKRGQKIREVFRPNILFYQEPYNRILEKNIRYKYNLKSLFCYVPYFSHIIDEQWSLNQIMLNLAWQIYFENQISISGCQRIMTNKGENCMVTGLPIMDQYLKKPNYYKDPWKGSSEKKRIIWAPHHTIMAESWVCTSTFFSYCEYMLSLAKKYKDQIQIAFKPHPVLLSKLYETWGKEKTDNYYSEWEKYENTQLVLGEYIGLFMHSDALIHDCTSFTVEYHYTQNPVMYLVKDENHAIGLNEFGKLAFDLHYKGKNEEDIEMFINNVINGKDEMKEARIKFYNDYLLPPNGKSASENIINVILG